jgi:shikimate kinase
MNNLLKGLNIYLIGLMGTGKSTVGKVIADELGYRFFDTDILIEKVAQKTINEIFAFEGEEYFRDLETKVLEQISLCTKSAIATGGGIILKQQNWGYLRNGLIVWLDVEIPVIVQRLQEDNTRPLLQEADMKSKLELLLEKRENLYKQADLHIKISELDSPETIAQTIINLIPTVLKEDSIINQ